VAAIIGLNQWIEPMPDIVPTKDHADIVRWDAGADDPALARAGRAEKAAGLKRERADQAETQQALRHAEAADTDRRAADARADAAMFRADAAEVDRRAAQAHADAAEARAQRTEDRRAELRDRLDAAQTEFVTAGQAAKQARRQDAQATAEAIRQADDAARRGRGRWARLRAAWRGE
jgi:colicin import membrane protein